MLPWSQRATPPLEFVHPRHRKIWPLTKVVSPRCVDGKDDELFTRKTHVFFAVFLTTLALFAAVVQYLFRPAECWCPDLFTTQMENYVNSFCFFADNYYLRITDTAPVLENLREATNYFRWTPFALLFLAALYLIPEIPLRVGSNLFSVNLGNILELSRQCNHGNNSLREDAVQQLTADLKSRFTQDGPLSRKTTLARLVGKLLPTLPFYIRLLHFSSKLTLLIASIVPIVFMHKTLQMNLNFHEQVWNNNIVANNNSYFPSNILCQFEILELQNIERYTVQCSVPANDMFQRMSILVGVLALVVLSVSISDFLSFLIGRLFEPWNTTYANCLMDTFAKTDEDYDQQMFLEFLKRYLSSDGLYLLQLIAQNSSEAVPNQIVRRLWKDYKKQILLENPMLTPLRSVLDAPLIENIELQNED